MPSAKQKTKSTTKVRAANTKNKRSVSSSRTKSGTGGLSSMSFSWKNLLLVVLAVAAVGGGFWVYRSMAGDALLATPGSPTGKPDCTAASGTTTQETSGSKRNANVCQLTSGRTISPVIFGNGSQTSTTRSQYTSLTQSEFETGYFKACYNIRMAGTASASVNFGVFNTGATPGAGTSQSITNTDYREICDPITHKAGQGNVFLTVTTGTVRIASIALKGASAPSTSGNTTITPGVSFYWPIGGSVNVSQVANDPAPRKLVDFDPFSASNAASVISQLKSQGNVSVTCYFSAGTAEDWRSDYNRFTAADKSVQLDDWEGEYILDTRSANVRNIMADRIRAMKNYGCTGIEPDNVDGYSYNSGFPLTRTTALNYLDFLQQQAHSHGMSVALKNSSELVSSTLPSGKKVTEAFDWVLVEECYQYNECDSYRPFVQAGKAVVIVEYGNKLNCADANSKNYDAYKMNLSLDGRVRTACR